MNKSFENEKGKPVISASRLPSREPRKRYTADAGNGDLRTYATNLIKNNDTTFTFSPKKKLIKTYRIGHIASLKIDMDITIGSPGHLPDFSE